MILTMSVSVAKEEYLIKGHSGLETGVILSETRLFARERKFMDRETIKDVLRRFNETGARYCLVGGLSLAHHSIPRRTQGVDIMALPEDLPLIQQLLKGYQQRGTPVVLIFQIGDTRIDVISANLKAKRAAVLGSVDDTLDDLPVKVVNLRDLIFLKMLAAPDHPERRKRIQDEADIIGLIEMNQGKISTEDIAYICRTLLTIAYTPEDMRKYRDQIEWLNNELEKMGLSDRRYDLQ